MDKVEAKRLTVFIRAHEHNKETVHIKLDIMQTGLGTAYMIRCNECKTQKNLANVEHW